MGSYRVSVKMRPPDNKHWHYYKSFRSERAANDAKAMLLKDVEIALVEVSGPNGRSIYG